MELTGVLVVLFLTIPAIFGYLLIFSVLVLTLLMTMGIFILDSEKNPDKMMVIKNVRSAEVVLHKIFPYCLFPQVFKKNKILIIEDDLSLRPFWYRIFQHLNSEFQIEWAISGEEALDLVGVANQNQKPFDLIISDLFLAGSKTGIELLNSPQVLESQAKTILVSAIHFNDLKQLFYIHKMKARFISKPLSPVNCEKVVTHLLTA